MQETATFYLFAHCLLITLIMPILLTGQCYREYPEFPILRINPALFGFSKDVSHADHIFQCPAFATDDGRYRLWCNWPAAGERELRKPMRLWAITEQDPTIPDPFLNPEYVPAKHFHVTGEDDLRFCSDNTKDLVLHLISHRYSSHLPVLDIDPTENDVFDWFAFLLAARLHIEPGTDPSVLDVSPEEMDGVALYMSKFMTLGQAKLRSIASKARENLGSDEFIKCYEE